METLWFGDKEVFAIELIPTPDERYFFGYNRIWVEGKYIGAIEDKVIVGTTLGSLLHISDRSEEINKHKLETDKDVYYFLKHSKHSDGDKFLPGFGDSFDDFNVYFYLLDGRAHFLWSLVPKPYFKYDGYLVENPQKFYAGKVSADYYFKQVMGFKNYFDTQMRLLNKTI